MQEHPHKLCPECQQPAHLNATTCSRCGRAFQTQFDTPSQTQIEMPPAPYGNYGQPQNPFPNQTPNPYNNPFPPSYPGYAQPPYPYVEQKSKVAAALLAFFLGGLGIHGFYLGNNAMGFCMLLISIFSCGTISGVICLIQMILYLCASDAEFHQKYVVEKRWF
jgi:TM2 domain-containing membrane protein YozV